MKQRILGIPVGAVLFVAALLAGPPPGPAAGPASDAARSPFLLWISVDTLRVDWLTPWGHVRNTTPALARWTRSWVLFDRAAATSSWTLPSMVSQITSLDPAFHGAVDPELARAAARRAAVGDPAVGDPAAGVPAAGVPAAGVPGLFEVLSEAGYRVLGVTANPFVSARFGLDRGFDILAETESRADAVTRRALELLDHAGPRTALFVHYMDPHLPYEPPPRFAPADPGTAGTVSLERKKLLYEGEIRAVDAAIGDLLADLEGRGLLDGAILAFSADHGEEFLEHGGRQHGPTLYEEVLRIPLALRIPGIEPSRIDDPVSGIDLAPTLVDALGLDPPAGWQGRSLLPRLQGEDLPLRPLIAETERSPDRVRRFSVRLGDLKLIGVVARREPPRIEDVEVYDLSADPGERRPLAPDASVRATLLRLAADYLKRAELQGADGRPAPLDPEARRRLRALGYLD